MSALLRVAYRYSSSLAGCGCCSESESVVEFLMPQVDRWIDIINFPLCENQEDLVEALTSYGFHCDENTVFESCGYF